MIDGKLKMLDLVAGPEGSYPKEFKVVNNKLWFSGKTAPGEGTLWYTDGTLAGSGHVGNLQPTAMEYVNGKLFFFAKSKEYGNELYTLDVPKDNQTITFEPITDKVQGGPTFNLVATATSGLPIVFNASPSDRVSINGNVVTILQPGSVTFTAVQNGNEAYKPADEVVTICIKPSKPTTTITNDQPLTKTLSSSSTTGNQWYKNNVAINGSTAQTLIVTEDGSYTVKVKADNCESEASDAKVITIVGLEPELNGSVYPNPVTDKLFVQWNHANEDVTASLIDITGRARTTQMFRNNTIIEMNDCATGVYILKLHVNDKVVFRRILKE